MFVDNEAIDQVTEWCDCNLLFQDQYAPIIPIHNGDEINDVSLSTSDGNKAVLLMTHSDGSFSAMTQRIPKKLKIGKEYSISLDMRFSKELTMQFEETGSHFFSFSNPVYLEVYAASAYCDHLELIYTSPVIRQEDWLTYTFDYIPIERIRYLTFQVQYERNETYNGHLFLDNVHMTSQK